MIDRIKAVWAAMRGELVVTGTGVVAVSRKASGDFVACNWVGMTAADAAKVLYQAADAVVEQLPAKSFKFH